MNALSEKRAFVLLLLICTLTTLPFLGLTDFNTKGEPREAIVAYSMMDTGNWILPENNGGDIAFKPPFFHWCIAVFSELTGGKVTEYTSRFPSATAAIVMLLCGFCFYARRRNVETAFVASLVAFTAFEVHRAAFACRVDMVLTACMIIALYSLFRWTENECRRIPWLAILLMSCGTLTKGPIAIILPCGATGAYLLIRGMNFWQMSWRLVLVAIASLIIPAVWYAAAYQYGGDEFLRLVKEENIDRFTGSMSYGSHENPWTYNVVTLVAGFVPWTLLLLFSLFSIHYSRPQGKISVWMKMKLQQFCRMEPYRLYSVMAIVVIFVFYCIPKSKRSVYLLPIYPFIAYFIAEFVIFLRQKCAKAFRVYSYLLVCIGVLLTVVFIIVKIGLIPDSLFHGKHAAENIAYLNALRELPVLGWGCFALLPVVGAFCWCKFRNVYALLAVTILLYLSLDVAIQPAVLNTKSDKAVAMKIKEICPAGTIDSYISVPDLHFFTVNFYNNNRVGVFDKDKAVKGYLLLGADDAKNFLAEHGNAFDFQLVYDSGKKSCDTKQIIQLYLYARK